MAWYKKWFGEDYLELYAHRDEGEARRQIEFVQRFVAREERPRRVLDLACGAGRHTATLRREGYRTFGVDLSLTLLAHPPRVPCAAGDMRSLPFADASFDWILNFFTSFGYFDHNRENFSVFDELARLLAPNGRFLIDFLNRDRVLADLCPQETQEIAGRTVDIERWYDPQTRRINKRMQIETTGQQSSTYLESVRAYTLEEVTIGLLWAGLEVESHFGNFQGDPFDRDSERLILVGTKPA